MLLVTVSEINKTRNLIDGSSQSFFVDHAVNNFFTLEGLIIEILEIEYRVFGDVEHFRKGIERDGFIKFGDGDNVVFNNGLVKDSEIIL